MRTLLGGAVLSLVTFGCVHGREVEVMPHARVTDPQRPLPGAIRWDAWIGDAPGYDVGREVERSLDPCVGGIDFRSMPKKSRRQK